jgi:hypothetical protein
MKAFITLLKNDAPMIAGVLCKAYRPSLIAPDTTKSSNRWDPLMKLALVEDVYCEQVIGSVCYLGFHLVLWLCQKP